jgi:hypothetical protein
MGQPSVRCCEYVSSRWRRWTALILTEDHILASSGRSVIGMVEATKDRGSAHWPDLRHLFLGWIRDPLLHPLMRPVVIEISRVFEQDTPQVRLTQHEHVIQTLPSHTSEEPFADGILLWCAVCGVHQVDAGRPGNAGKELAVFAVVVNDEMLWPPAERRGLTHLLCLCRPAILPSCATQPPRCRMSGI